MNPHLFMGLFALYVVVVSLVRLMAEREFPRLTAMKRIWGRRRGLTMHFLSNVALPLVFGIVFLSQGVTAFDPSEGDDFSPLNNHLTVSASPPGHAGSGEAASLLFRSPTATADSPQKRALNPCWDTLLP